jgi:hypothetical protein
MFHGSINHVSITVYALYFRGPEGLKFEVVHMPLAEQRARSLGLLPTSR